MSTTYSWIVHFLNLPTWKSAADDSTIESDTFKTAKATWRLICSPNKGKWYIRLQCVDIPLCCVDRTIRVNWQINCMNEDGKLLYYPIVEAASLQQHETSRACPMATTENVKKAAQLKIRCIIQETMIMKNDEFIWRIDKNLMDYLKSMRPDEDFTSPYFCASGETEDKFIIICRKKEKYFEGVVKFFPKNQRLNQIIAANVRIEIPEIGVLLKDSRVFFKKQTTRIFQWFETEVVEDLQVVTFHCKITPAKAANISKNSDKFVWKINNTLLKEFELADNKQSFLSPMMMIDDAAWYFEISPKVRGEDNDFTCVALRCMSAELYSSHSLIYSNIAFKEIKSSHFNIYRACDLFTARKNKILKFCTYETAKQLDAMTIEISIKSNRKIWKMSMKQLISNQYQFTMHRMTWQLQTTDKYVTFALVDMPSFIQDAAVCVEIKSAKLKVKFQAVLRYNFNHRDNWKKKIKLNAISNDSDEKESKDEEKRNNEEEIIILCDILLLPDNTEAQPSKCFQFDPIVLAHQEVDIKHEVKDENATYQKHRSIMNKWNENSTKLKAMCSLNEQLVAINEDEKKADDECVGDSLFKKYSECIGIINAQSARLEQVTTDDYLLQLLNMQNSLSKSIKEKESKQPSGLKKYNVKNKKYETLKQQRIYLQNKIEREFKECNQMIQRENDLFQKVQRKLSENKCVETDIDRLKSSSASCVSVIKLYNEFMEQNKKYIDTVNATFDDLWRKFESKWMTWKVNDIIAWFKYKTIKINTNKTDWEKVQIQLQTRNITGKYLKKFNDFTFELIGVHDFEIVNHLVAEIEILKKKYDCQNAKNSNPSKIDDIPKEYLCQITKQIMQDPVIAFDGHSYDRNAIESYLKIHKKSPITGANADIVMVFPNHKLKRDIQTYIKNNNIDLEKLNRAINEGIAEGNEKETIYI